MDHAGLFISVSDAGMRCDTTAAGTSEFFKNLLLQFPSESVPTDFAIIFEPSHSANLK
jgi:hypothetical protein